MSKKPEKKYILVEFPYPSGEGLHMGHLRPYVAGDVYSRFCRMKGYEVMYPIGWDAFGLPAENFAIKKGIHPSITTKQNIANAKKQLKSWGISFDWDRELNTTDPKYYKWTQWIFLRFLKAGLAYEATGLINWCPKDKTGLANEEVIDGRCERCGTPVVKKEMKQWYLKITDYAEKLLKGLKTLDWPEHIKLQQENWIGKSEGAEIEFEIKVSTSPALRAPSPRQGREGWGVKVFTTRPDTIFGATYMVLAPEHPIVASLLKFKNQNSKIKNIEEVKRYIEKAKEKTELQRTAAEKEKTGVQLKGIKAINPATKEEIPVWIADYVLMGYGTGAIMAVPGHDERDFEFAKKHNLPIRAVIRPIFSQNEKDRKLDKFLIEAIDEVREKKYKLIIGGGWAIDIFANSRIRNHDDIDFYVPHEQVSWWRERFERLGFTPLYDPKKDKRYFVELTKGDMKVGFIGIGTGKDGQIYDMEWGKPDKWPFKEKEIVLRGKFHGREVNYFGPEVKKWYNFKAREKDIIDLSVIGEGAYIGEGELINSFQFDGLTSEQARKKITEKFGKKKVQYKLRDWVFSRQRYWGEPIPVIHCEKCGVVPVPEEELPVKLPKVEKYEPTGTGESPLAVVKEWVNVKCPQCDGPGKRETNTMPQWAGSSWYYLRYTDPKNTKKPFDKLRAKKWLPVDVYFGGLEHTTLHLLYSRFWHLFLYDQGIVPTPEPYAKRVPHGIVLGPDGEKMSKSRGNVVNPDEIVDKYGADVLRMYELFLGPHEDTVSWNSRGILGVKRFLEKVRTIFLERPLPNPPHRLGREEKKKALSPGDGERGRGVEILLHKTIKKVTEDVLSFKFNTAVSALMILANEFSIKHQELNIKDLEIFLKLLAPFAPYLAEELWYKLHGQERTKMPRTRTDKSQRLSASSPRKSVVNSIHEEKWPEYEEKLVKDEQVSVVVQVNGKRRGTVLVDADAAQGQVEDLAKQDENVKRHLEGQKIRKAVYVPGKIINFVI